MINFLNFLTEDKAGKNLHLEHIEDEIINFGIDGGRAAINFIRSLRDMLAGASRSSVNMTVKWDGAPAIFAGTDPSDGKFFVAKKSVFNATPKLYKSNEEIDADLKGALNSKFKVALAEFPKLGIKGVLQGDLMFTDDIETKKIDGVEYFTFQPNTIVYAVPTKSDIGKQISKSKIGVVWHTTYEGTELQSMSAKFGADVSKMKKISSIWYDDATYKDVSGSAVMTADETKILTKHVSDAGKTFHKIKAPLYRSFLDMQSSFTGNMIGASLKTYSNSKVRAGETVSNPKSFAVGYLTWVEGVYQKNIDKIKTEKRKVELENKKQETIRELKKHIINIENLISFQNHIVNAKLEILKKLNSVRQLTDTFVRTSNGYKVTAPEGYVAIDRISGNAVKLVDRMEFSFNNFTAIKSWDK